MFVPAHVLLDQLQRHFPFANCGNMRGRRGSAGIAALLVAVFQQRGGKGRGGGGIGMDGKEVIRGSGEGRAIGRKLAGDRSERCGPFNRGN